MPAFWNQITIGAANSGLRWGGATSVTLTSGTYFWDTLITELTTQVVAIPAAGFRVALSSTGHITLDNSGGANFSIDWNDTNGDSALRDLLGFTGDLSGANQYIAPRRIRAALYLENGSGVTNATILEHDPKPVTPMATQTVSLGGVTRTTIAGTILDEAEFAIQFIDNSARHTSPSGAVATTYANAASTATGLTQYTHARDLWWDSTAVNTQGWNDGRPVRYFATSSDASDALGGGTWTASGYTTWVFGREDCERWQAVKARPPKSTQYHLTVHAREYVAP